LLRALRVSRPDAEITLLAKHAFVPLLETWKIADRLRPLPPQRFGYFSHFWRMRAEFPDVWVLFTNSVRGDLEAWLSGCRQRFGIVRRGKSRPLLSHAYRVPVDFDERQHHQLELWEAFFRRFGLNVPLAREPMALPASSGPEIGLICGSENNPEKRWPVAHWRALIEALPSERFVLFGTANDAAITAKVQAGLDSTRVADLAGKTDLPTYVSRLSHCRLLVTNDTGGMHLANALGVPLIALFGPTNPIRTGPVFNAPVRILQPAGCPREGGADLSDLTVDRVLSVVNELLAQSRISV
jgi:heptosyltransferase-2